MARNFAAAGHRLVGPGDVADLYVFNTCAVTHIAARKSRQIIRQMRRANPNGKVVVTGCYAELSPQEIEALGVDMVVGNDKKDQLPHLVAQAGLLPNADPIPAPDTPLPSPASHKLVAALFSGSDCLFLPSVLPGRSRQIFMSLTCPGEVLSR